MPKDDSCDQSPIRILCPNISSLSFEMDIDSKTRSLKLEIPNQGLNVNVELPGLKMKDLRACAEHKTLFLQGKLLSESMEAMKDGNISNIIANDIIHSFYDIAATRSLIYYDMFSDRSILGKGLCRVIATQSPMNSFTIYKHAYGGRLSIEMSMPGLQKMKLTTQGLSVALEMRQIVREQVKVFFEYDTFFIEGKTKEHHYITGIHLPEGIQKKHNLIKRRMNGEVFYATLPCCVKKEELPCVKDQLKLLE